MDLVSLTLPATSNKLILNKSSHARYKLDSSLLSNSAHPYLCDRTNESSGNRVPKSVLLLDQSADILVKFIFLVLAKRLIALNDTLNQ